MEKVNVEKYVKILKRNNIKANSAHILYITKQLEQNSFEHVVYDFPEHIPSLIKYYEQIEQYEKCAEIIRFVKSYNKLEGKNVKTK